MLKFYVSLQNMLERLSRNEEGQTAVEYGLVVALIAAVIVVALAAGLVHRRSPTSSPRSRTAV